ncbi:MAG: hypothetical protein V3U75_01200 [Methylococcaceae bacterium]
MNGLGEYATIAGRFEDEMRFRFENARRTNDGHAYNMGKARPRKKAKRKLKQAQQRKNRKK